MSTPPPAPIPDSTEQQIVDALNAAAPLVESGLTLVGQPGAAALVATLEQLVTHALAALQAAKGQPVTAQDVLLLAPAPITLTAPSA